jgi:hypothetical protein
VLIVYAHPQVSEESARHICRLADKLNATINVPHRLPVYLVPTQSVAGRDGKAGFAVFFCKKNDSYIIIGARQSNLLFPKLSDHLSHLETCLCHEVAHYEQWRDGRKLQERGVAVRARSLLSLAKQAKVKRWSRVRISIPSGRIENNEVSVVKRSSGSVIEVRAVFD